MSEIYYDDVVDRWCDDQQTIADLTQRVEDLQRDNERLREDRDYLRAKLALNDVETRP